MRLSPLRPLQTAGSPRLGPGPPHLRSPRCAAQPWVWRRRRQGVGGVTGPGSVGGVGSEEVEALAGLGQSTNKLLILFPTERERK